MEVEAVAEEAELSMLMSRRRLSFFHAIPIVMDHTVPAPYARIETASSPILTKSTPNQASVDCKAV